MTRRAYVVDFHLSNSEMVIEWKSRRIKGVSPGVRCVAFVEVEQADSSLVKETWSQ